MLVHSLSAAEIVDADIIRKKDLYAFDTTESIQDITGRVLQQLDLTEQHKRQLIEQKRRFILFCFPSDGLQIPCMLSFVETPEVKPIILLLRGGSRLHGVPAFTLNDSSFPYLLATEATLVLGTYRDGLSPEKDEYGGEDVNDVNNLANYLPLITETLSLPVDWENFYAIGISRGTMQMFLALSRFEGFQKRIKKAVSNCGLVDLDRYAHNNPEVADKWKEHFGYTSQEWLDIRNPRCAVKRIRKDLPILVLQGTQDFKIPVEDARGFVEMLNNFGFKHVSYFEVDGGNHALKNKNGCVDHILEWLTNDFFGE